MTTFTCDRPGSYVVTLTVDSSEAAPTTATARSSLRSARWLTIRRRLGNSFLLSFLALGIGYVSRLVTRHREVVLGLATFWTANIVSAVLFGLGHLHVTAQLVGLTPVVVMRAIVLNGILGVVAGYLFWRRGIEMAMLCHFSADVILHVVAPLLQPSLLRIS
jgi:membrane protease YdiL (CAAX protease family)